MKEKKIFFARVTYNMSDITLHLRLICIITEVPISISTSVPEVQLADSYPVGCYIVLYVLGELFLVGVLVLLHQVPHVVGHVLAHDVLAVHLSVELFAFRVVARETFGAAKQQGQAR